MERTLEQINRLHQAGCDIVRLTVPDLESARAFGKIRRQSPLPLVADIHFDYKVALAVAEEGADKIRINPGNIGGPERVRAVADACRSRGIPIRIGVRVLAGARAAGQIRRAHGGGIGRKRLGAHPPAGRLRV